MHMHVAPQVDQHGEALVQDLAKTSLMSGKWMQETWKKLQPEEEGTREAQRARRDAAAKRQGHGDTERHGYRDTDKETKRVTGT